MAISACLGIQLLWSHGISFSDNSTLGDKVTPRLKKVTPGLMQPEYFLYSQHCDIELFMSHQQTNK